MSTKNETADSQPDTGRGRSVPDCGETLADFLADDLDVISIGLNPSLSAVREGYYFATPQNRFWRALNASGLVRETLTPSVDAMHYLLHEARIGFTDVVKRPSSSGKVLRAVDYREWAPVLREKLLKHRPCIAWFHGKQAYVNYIQYTQGRRGPVDWGEQADAVAVDGTGGDARAPGRIGVSRIFVTPNPSPANAAFSLAVITEWFRRLQVYRESVCRR